MSQFVYTWFPWTPKPIQQNHWLQHIQQVWSIPKYFGFSSFNNIWFRSCEKGIHEWDLGLLWKLRSWLLWPKEDTGVIHRNHKTIEPFHLETYGIHIINRIFQPETFLEICEQLHWSFGMDHIVSAVHVTDIVHIYCRYKFPAHSVYLINKLRGFL